MEGGVPQESPTQGRGKRTGTHSGRLLLRMPESLHADLAKASERAGVSLNGYINDALANAVGKPPPKPVAAVETPAQRPRRRLVERLLVINLVVIAAVGALVIVLLVQALH